MASRGFSSSVRAAKALKWKFNGTTVQVDQYMKAVEMAVDALPSKFAAKATVGIIQGNPHETPENNDPMHASGRIGEGSASGKKRLSSFHAYSDGSVIFSDPALKPFNKGPDEATSSGSQAAGTGSSNVLAGQSNNSNSSDDLVWRTNEQTKYAEWWDGTTWVNGEWSDEYQKWYARYNGQYYYW